MFLGVQPDCHILRQQLVFALGLLCVLFVHGTGAAPFCRAVFLPPAVVPACGEVDADAHSVAEKQNEDSFYTVLAKLDMERVVHRVHQARQYLRQPALDGRSDEKSEPYHGNDTDKGEDDRRPPVVTLIHGRSSPFSQPP